MSTRGGAARPGNAQRAARRAMGAANGGGAHLGLDADQDHPLFAAADLVVDDLRVVERRVAVKHLDGLRLAWRRGRGG